MSRIFSLLSLIAFASCQRSAPPTAESAPAETKLVHTEAEIEAEAVDYAAALVDSAVRINATLQQWNPGQPWEKRPPRRRRSLGAIVAGPSVLTTAEMVADATFIELESPDGKRLAPARVKAIDYEANLALLELEDPQNDAEFFTETEPLEIAPLSAPGDVLDILQVEDNGTPLVTSGPIQSIDVASTFLPGQFFLTYEVKASMQSAASSYSLPALRDGKLAGLLTSYNSKDQISDITATEIVTQFLEDAQDGEYRGFPSLGIATTRTDDPNFRSWLKLGKDQGGIYVSTVRPKSAAAEAGIEKGDVIVNIDGYDVDRIGYVEHDLYGRLFWSHLVRGSKSSGDTVELIVLRDGEITDITATLERRDIEDQLVPAYTFGRAPNFLVKGGLVFQELTRPLLDAFGDDFPTRVPLNLLDVYENPEKYEDRAERIVFLAGVIATEATVGYEPLRNLIVTEVNGKTVRDMKSLIEAFNEVPDDGLHSIDFDDEEFTVYLDEIASTRVDEQFIQRGLTRLSRAE